jgi:hypothetical protein
MLTKRYMPAIRGALNAGAKLVNRGAKSASQFVGGATTGRGDTGAARTGAAVGGAVKDVAGAVSGAARVAFPALASAARQVIDALKPAQPFLSNVLLPLLKGLAIGVLGSVVGAFKVVIPIVKAFATVLGAVGRVLRPFRGVIQGIGTVLGFVFGGPILKGLSALGKLGRVGRLVAGVFRLLRIPIQALGGVLGVAGRVLLRFGGFLMRGITYAQRLAGTFRGPVRSALLAVLNPLRVVGGKIGDFVSGAIKKIGTLKNGIKRIMGGAANVIESAFSSVKSAVVSAINWLINKANGIIRAFNNTAGRVPGVHNIGTIGKLSDDAETRLRTPTPVHGGAAGTSDAASTKANAMPLNRASAASMLPPVANDFAHVTVRTAAGEVFHRETVKVERRRLEASGSVAG